MSTPPHDVIFFQQNHTLSIALSVISSLLFAISFELFILPQSANWREVASSVFGLIIIASLGCVAYRCLARITLRSIVIAGIFSCLYSVALVLASNITNYGSLSLTKASTYLAILFCIPFLAIITSRVLISLSSSYSKQVASKKHFGFIFSYLKGRSRYSYFFMWGFIFVCWLPILLAEYPGAWTFDVLSQTQHLLTEEPISAKHPVIHTLWLSGCIWISNYFLGSYAPGLVAYTIIQMLILSALLARVVLITTRWKCSFMPIVSLLVYALFPGFSLWSVIATKDVLFFGLFALCLALLIDLLISIKADSVQKRQWIYFGIALLFMFLFRNNAVYGFVIFLIVCLFIIKKYRKQFFLVSLSALCAYGILTGPISDAAGIEPGDKREMLSVPMSQLASVAVKDSAISEEDLEFIETYIPDWKKYDPHIADPIKATFNTDAVTEDPLYFIKGYLGIGLKNPLAYTDAFASLCKGFWAPSMAYTKNDMTGEMTPFKIGNRDVPEGEYISIQTESKFPQLYSLLTNIRDQKAELVIPGFASFFQVGTWVWLIILYIASCIYNKNKLFIIPALFFMCYWLTLLFGPVSIYRYGVVALACAPIFISILISLKRPRST